MFEGGGYDQMVDVWALGVTIFKLMTGFTPFESQYLIDTIHNIVNQEVVFPDKLKFPCSQAPKQLVKRLLKKSKEERLTADEALKDVWFLSLWEDQWDELNRSLTTSNPSSYL
jgi:serine/threonine protein kinase